MLVKNANSLTKELMSSGLDRPSYGSMLKVIVISMGNWPDTGGRFGGHQLKWTTQKGLDVCDTRNMNEGKHDSHRITESEGIFLV